MIIVLAIDGLDPILVDKLGLKGLQQEACVHLAIPEDISLHTEVIWPTIITGVRPKVHGLTRTSARKWKNPLLQLMAKIASSILPTSLLLPIGKRIQLLGFQRQARGNPEYYQKKGLKTIFSDVRSKVVAVPGYAPSETTDHLRRLGGHSTYKPIVEIEELVDQLQKEFTQRARIVQEGIKSPVNIMMVYIFSIDMIGHLFWDRQDIIKEWYGKCQQLVKGIRAQMSKDDMLLVISDHGMEQGRHARRAFFSCSSKMKEEEIPGSILEIKPFIERALENTKQGHKKVREHLEDLGYI